MTLGPEAAGGSLSVAAVDLGSNSFHMVIARAFAHDLHILDRLREPVRLAEALGEDGRLGGAAAERALECLARFGQRLRGLPPSQVRAVGTNTLRRAVNAREFAREAHRALGHPIEVISGQEEARLIYLGVSHMHPLEGRRRLVVDVGGGSTEIIVGEGFEVLRSHSLYMGCVNQTRVHFPGGVLTREAFRTAETAAALELRAVREGLRHMGWDAAIGSSGTIGAVSELLRVNGWEGPAITLPRLKKLRKAMVAAGSVDRLRLEGLRPERAPVLAGGLAILFAVFRSLEIETMVSSTGALREGVLYDLVGRIEHHDVRDRTIRRLVEQYHVDLAQAGRVEKTALGLFAQIESQGESDPATARRLLTWAALLHEIGLTVSYTGYHKHGAYLVSHMDLPGFSENDQRVLAALIRGHRRKLGPAVFAELSPEETGAARQLCILLRLAVLLNRSRSPGDVPVPEVTWKNGEVELTFPGRWLEDHPLSRADLAQETDFLRAGGTTLVVRENEIRPDPATSPDPRPR